MNNPLKYTDPSGEQYYYDYDRGCYVDDFGNRADYADVYKNMFQSGYFRGGNAAFSTYGWNPPFVMGGSGGTTSENAQQKLNQYIELLEVLGVKVTKGNAHANYIWLSFAYQLSPSAEDVSNNILGAAVTEGFKYYYRNNGLDNQGANWAGHLIGPAMIASGQAWIPKSSWLAKSIFPRSAAVMGTKQLNTSLSSLISRRISLKFGASFVGGKIAHAIPIIGWAITAFDAQYNSVAEPNIKQIQSNVINNINPLENTYNPTTGDYYAPGYFDGFGFW